jgi:hypothetical protein
MKFTLEQNAADSLRRSVRYFAENTPSGLKASVKELVSALELFLKHQLSQLDLNPSFPVLVYEDFLVKVSANPRQYVLEPRGEKTVTFDKAIERLGWLGSPIAKPDVAMLNQLKRIRNELEHFEVDQPPALVRSTFSAVVGFVIRYLHVYLNLSFYDLVDGEEWREALLVEPSLRSLAERSAREVYKTLITAEHRAIGVSKCVKCGADCMISDKAYYDGFRCVVCGFRHDIEECHSCREVFFIDLLSADEGDTLICDYCHKNAWIGE